MAVQQVHPPVLLNIQRSNDLSSLRSSGTNKNYRYLFNSQLVSVGDEYQDISELLPSWLFLGPDFQLRNLSNLLRITKIWIHWQHLWKMLIGHGFARLQSDLPRSSKLYLVRGLMNHQGLKHPLSMRETVDRDMSSCRLCIAGTWV